MSEAIEVSRRSCECNTQTRIKSMQVSQFIVPAQAYPRYKYTQTHATPLFERFAAVLPECGLKDPYPTPVFGDVDIYVVTIDHKALVKRSDLSIKDLGKIKEKVLPNVNPDELQLRVERNKASIIVASYSQTRKNENILSIAGDFILIVDEQLKVETPECKVNDKIMLTVEKKSLPEQIGLLLERLVLREFRVRLTLLDALMAIDTQAVFATLDEDIKKALESRPLSSSRIRRPENPSYDTTSLLKKYYSVRMEMVEKRIKTFYSKELGSIRNQLLEFSAPECVYPLTVCDAIQSQIADDTPDLDQPGRVSKLMPEVKCHLQFSEVEQKAKALENRLKNHVQKLNESIDLVEHLRGEMIGMIKRSKIPEIERPKYTLPVLHEEVAKKILAVEGVTGCGYRYTTLDIFLRDNLSDENRDLSEDQLTAVMSNNGIQNFKFRTEQEVVTVYAGVGTQVTSLHEKNASLGGFAKKGVAGNDELCVLLARHFANLGKPVYVRESNGTKRLMAHVLDPNIKIECPLDIAVASVLKSVRDDCQTQFRNSDGEQSTSRLSEFEPNDLGYLTGIPVHIWGAASSPGLGVIITPEHFVQGMNRLVRIEDRHQRRIIRFATNGDSGAIVCADHPDGEFVHVVSMLMGSPLDDVGEDQRKEYLSLRLKDGLLQLHLEHATDFRLC